jgi:hypothetical protein
LRTWQLWTRTICLLWTVKIYNNLKLKGNRVSDYSKYKNGEFISVISNSVIIDCLIYIYHVVLFKKLLTHLFLILHGHNIHSQQWKLSTFLMLTAGARDQFPRWRHSRRRCPGLWLQCTVSFVYSLKKMHHTVLMDFLNCA